MRNEVLRMERVTYKEDEVVKLEDFNLQIFQGEIMGFMPVNSHGKTALLKLLERNLPLYDGYIYYGGEKVNTWKELQGSKQDQHYPGEKFSGRKSEHCR